MAKEGCVIEGDQIDLAMEIVADSSAIIDFNNTTGIYITYCPEVVYDYSNVSSMGCLGTTAESIGEDLDIIITNPADQKLIVNFRKMIPKCYGFYL